MTSKNERSPLDREAPLRVAGQSLSDELDSVVYDNVLAPFMMATLMVLLAGLEWFRFLYNIKPNPVLYTIVAIVFVFYAAWKILRSRKRIARIKLGRDGERAVAQYLEWFRTANFFVFHDVPNGDANVDHVLIGPQGVFTIETKALTKPRRGEPKVTVREGVIRANGSVLDRNPLVQAKAQAGWLRSFFAESRFDAFVWPVVTFPGWFVEPFDSRATGAWVVNPKALSGYVEKEPERHSREQVQAMASALTSYIRAQASK